MTTEGAIKTMEDTFEDFKRYLPLNYIARLDTALAALQAQTEVEKNEPLTLGELREMDGEKIYVHYIDGFYTDEDGAYFGKFEQLVRDCDGKLTACSLPLEFYGREWLAYRRKPEKRVE